MTEIFPYINDSTNPNHTANFPGLQLLLLITAAVAVFLSLMLPAAPVQAQTPLDLNVDSAVLLDADTGQTLLEKNPKQQLPVGSLNKIMTLLLIMEEIEKGSLEPQTKVTVSRFAESMGGSQIFLSAGTKIKIQNLIKAVAIASANDAAVVLAEAAAGNEKSFVKAMNKRAEQLNMENTKFLNSTGLPPASGNKQFSTVTDIAKMSRTLITKYPRILELTSTWVEYLNINEREVMLANTNKLLNNYAGLDGLRTGYTEKAGYCLAATAKRGDLRLLTVVLNADSKEGRRKGASRLLDYGFNRFEKRILIEKDKKVHNIQIPGGEKLTTTARSQSQLSLLVKRGQPRQITRKITLKKDLKAPIKKGDVIGYWSAYQQLQNQGSSDSGNNDKNSNNKKSQKQTKIGQVNLIATESIDRAGFLTIFWRKVKGIFQQN